MGETYIAYERNFDTLLMDSIEFLSQALSYHPVYDEGHTLSRASIIFSLLLLEAAANSCIDHLDLERSIQREIDKLPVLGKYDFYLRCKFREKRLSRGVVQIEWVRELKSIRDGLVHLKPHKVEWKRREDGNGESASATRTAILKVATNPKFWDGEEAAKVAKAVHGFLRYFFKDTCRYSATKVASILFSESKTPGGENYFQPCMGREAKEMLARHSIDLSYVKIVWL